MRLAREMQRKIQILFEEITEIWLFDRFAKNHFDVTHAFQCEIIIVIDHCAVETNQQKYE